MLRLIPKWVWGVLVLVAVLVGWLAFRARDERIRAEALLQDRIAATEQQLGIARDSLRSARAKTDTIVRIVNRTVTEYRDQRARVDTLKRTDTLRIDSIPPGHVVVPIEYVRSADSLAIALPLLEARIRIERIAADSLSKIQQTEILALKDLNRVTRGSWTTKLKWAGVGAGLALGAVTVFRN